MYSVHFSYPTEKNFLLLMRTPATFGNHQLHTSNQPCEPGNRPFKALNTSSLRPSESNVARPPKKIATMWSLAEIQDRLSKVNRDLETLRDGLSSLKLRKLSLRVLRAGLQDTVDLVQHQRFTNEAFLEKRLKSRVRWTALQCLLSEEMRFLKKRQQLRTQLQHDSDLTNRGNTSTLITI